MSGFLHRLAGAVLRPQQRIHPLVGSLYAGHQVEPEIGDGANDVKSLQSSHLLPRDVSPHETPAASNSSLTRAQNENRVLAQEERPEAAAVDVRNRRTKAVSRIHPERSAQGESTAETQSYAPLLTASIVPRTSETSVALMDRAVLPSVSPGPMIYATRSERTEPDEIQIHIGRIEVTAVPQTLPSAPARAARKAPSLEEYLRRRDERAQ